MKIISQQWACDPHSDDGWLFQLVAAKGFNAKAITLAADALTYASEDGRQAVEDTCYRRLREIFGDEAER